MRARYLVFLGFGLRLSNLATPYLAGLVIDNYDPDWIWYACGFLGLITILGFGWLHLRTRHMLSSLELTD